MVSEKIKTWYFPYSAFWLTGQWGKSYSPPAPPPPGYATEWNTFFPEFRWRPARRCTPESNYWRGCRCKPYSNYWGGYSQIIGGIYPPIHPPGFGTPDFNIRRYLTDKYFDIVWGCQPPPPPPGDPPKSTPQKSIF